MANPTVMRHDFSRVPQAEIPRSSFDRSHGYKTTLDAGYLVPVFVDEALPGDTFNLQMTAFGRLATLLHPFMDNLFLDSFFFAVPLRLVWDNWQRFNGEQDNPADSTDFLIPQCPPPAGGWTVGSLGDYYGIPTGVDNLDASALFFRAYNLIWNEWFRDQNLQDSVDVPKGDGPDLPATYQLLRRGKRHDYFTSALPWPQKGPAVQLPLGDQAWVRAGPAAEPNFGHIVSVKSDYAGYGSNYHLRADGVNTTLGSEYTGGDGRALYADLSASTAATINQLRQAFQIQRLYERDARGGTRYIEIIKSHFGVTSPDARLQRPEYLGGGSTPISINPIAQTSETTVQSPQANLGAIGTLTVRNNGFTKSFTEHCIIIGMVSVRADLNYQQGLNRMFSRKTRWDFFWPALAHLGEQEILNKEIYSQGTATDDLVFGYQERYAEYRYKPSVITGQMRSTYTSSLDTWHLAQEFGALPTLNATFIQDDPPIDRVIAVPTEPHLIFDSYFKLRTARPMPIYSVPGLIDHF